MRSYANSNIKFKQTSMECTDLCFIIENIDPNTKLIGTTIEIMDMVYY